VGTIFLLLDCQWHPDGLKVGVSLRGVWSLSPLENHQGRAIIDKYAGTYLSGFTAKAYLALNGRKAIHGKSHRGLSSNGPKLKSLTTVSAAEPSLFQLCFYDFGPTFSRQLTPLLTRLPYIHQLEPQDSLCRQPSDCRCFQLQYQGGLDALNQLLHRQLRTSEVLPFEMVINNPQQIDLIHDGGFK
jgi:hypothetical protein